MDDNKDQNPPQEPAAIDDSAFENVEHPSPYPTSQTQESSFVPPPPPRRRSPKKFLYILGAILLVLVVLNVVRTLGSKEKSTPSPTPAPISIETPTPETVVEEETPTPEPTKKPVSSIDATTGLDRAKLSLTVQNGSGESGVAGKMADLLKSLGYNVTSTENADNFNYTNITIKVKPASKEYLPVLNKDLSSNNYTVGSATSDLTATSSADALVIVGK